MQSKHTSYPSFPGEAPFATTSSFGNNGGPSVISNVRAKNRQSDAAMGSSKSRNEKIYSTAKTSQANAIIPA